MTAQLCRIFKLDVPTAKTYALNLIVHPSINSKQIRRYPA